MEDYDQAESKYGRIYKVAGPRKYQGVRANHFSGRRRKNVRINDVRACKGWLGKTCG